MVPSALRTRLMMGPGPEDGGSKNSMSRPHWPDRSGMAEPLSAATAVDINAAAEKTKAILPGENRRGERMRIPDISPSLVGSATLALLCQKSLAVSLGPRPEEP